MSESVNPPAGETGALRVYYDGGCPVCTQEIAFYRSRPAGHDVTWVNVDACAAAELGAGLTRKQAIERLHIRLPNGTLVSGAAAFAVIWRRMPGFQWLGKLIAFPPLGLIAELGYRGFLVVRRLWRRGTPRS